MVNRENLKKAYNELCEFKKRKNKKYKFYSFDNLFNNYDFDVMFSIGTRSTGKTTAIQRDSCLKDFLDGYQFVKLCRIKDELKKEFQSGWWSDIFINTLHKYDIDIVYHKSTYYINNRDEFIDENGELMENDFVKSGEVFGYVIPISLQQRYKSKNYSKVKKIVFDEFAKMKDYSYSSSEINDFLSLLSTVVRMRDDVKVLLVGNVLSPHNPYFKLFGIDGMKLKSGKTYAFIDDSMFDNPCLVGVEYGESVTDNIEDIPRLLRLPHNEQAIKLDMYQLPVEVIDSDSQLLKVLDKNKLLDFYQYYGILRISIDDNFILRKNNKGEYVFKHIDYLILYDINNNQYYFTKGKNDDEYGLYIDYPDNLPIYKLDYDVRNNAPFLPGEVLRSRLIYGDLKIYEIIRGWIDGR